MIDQTKIESYKEVYNALKEMGQLKDFRYPKQKKHLDFSCVAGDTIIKFRLFSDKDLLQLRAEQQCKEKDDEKNGNRIREIAEKYNGVFGTAYDGNAILNMSVPLTSTADDVAKNLVLEKTKEFAGIVINEMADMEGKYEYDDADETTSVEEPDKADNEPINEEQESLSDAFAGIMADMGPDEHTPDEIAATEENTLDEEEMPGPPDEYDSTIDDVADIFNEVADEAIPDEQIDTEDDEMAGAVRRKMEQQEYRENILQDMRNLVAHEQAVANEKKREAEEAAEKNRAESERLSESWSKYHKSKNNLEKRTTAVAEREKKAMARELEIAQREEEIKDREATINALVAENEEKSKDLERSIERNHNLLKTLESREETLNDLEQSLKTKEKSLDLRQERIEMDRKTVEDSIQDMYAMEKMLNEMKGQIVPVDTSRLEKKIKTLNAEKEQLQGAMKKTTSVAADYKKRYEETAVIKEQLQEQVQKLEAEIKDLSGKEMASGEAAQLKAQSEETLQKLQDEQNKSAELEKELNEIKRKNNELSEKLSTTTKGPVIETLGAAGYTVSPIAGEGNPLLTFEIDGCTAIIDEHLGMVCLEKKVKRNYIKTFDGWNSQSFAETYSMSNGKAYCRFVYENIVEDVRRISAKLNTLK